MMLFVRLSAKTSPSVSPVQGFKMQSTDTPSLGLAKATRARDEAQNVCQWLARMAQSFGNAKAPTNELIWNRLTRTFSTPEVAPGTVLELKLPEMILHFTESGKPSAHDMDVEGKSPAEVEAWLLVEMLHRGFERERFSKVLPYNWLKLMTGDEMKYSPESVVHELELLTNYLEKAASILLRVKTQLNIQPHLSASPALTPQEVPDSLKCWPDRFEIGFTSNAAATDPGVPNRLRIGFTAGDCRDVEPRFFVRRLAEDAPQAEAETCTIAFKQILERNMSDEDVSSHIVDCILNQNVKRLSWIQDS
jgi:hypothetical protein